MESEILILIIVVKHFLGQPIMNVSSGNLTTSGGLLVSGETTQCYDDKPRFSWDLVTVEGSLVLNLKEGEGPTVKEDVNCEGGQHKYLGTIRIEYSLSTSAAFGKTWRIRLTINNDQHSTYSNFTLTFRAPYSLTGSSTFAKLNEMFSWTCEVTLIPENNNYAVDFYRNQMQIGYVGTGGNGCVTKHFNKSNYVLNCTSNKALYTVTIPAQFMTENEQNSLWFCTYRNNFQQSSSVKQLNIAISVENISMKPNNNPLEIIEGTKQVIQCEVNRNAFPEPSFEWFVSAQNITTSAETGKFRSNITLIGVRQRNGKTLECKAKNSISVMKSLTTLNITYKPEVAAITSSPYSIVEGQTATLKCSVTAANPNTDIKWSWTKSDGPSNEIHTGSTYTISNIHRNQSGTYNCSASNSIGTSTPATMEVDVHYTPEVSTTTSSPNKVVEGQTATMSCSVTAANPNTDIGWSWMKTDSPSNVLHTGSTYAIPKIQRGQSGNYSCRANNSIGVSTPATIQVDVQYTPEVSTTTSSPYKVVEGQTATMSCSVTAANPNADIKWSWIKTDSPRNVLYTSPTYTIPNIQRGQSGTYNCRANNSIGMSSPATIQVDVQYPPITEIFQASGNKTYEESSPFSITCKVDSHPFADINIQNVDTGELKASGGSLESLTYRESSAKCYHNANYTCNSKNLHGSTSSTVQRIFVLCTPRPYDGPLNIDTGIKTNEGLNISTKFIGYPLPIFSWTFKENLADDYKTLSGEFQASFVPLNVSTILTVLTKNTLNQNEFGYYKVTATNPGKPSEISIVTYHVIPERKPNPPYNISINCMVSHGTAVVNWVPGFDGGAEQKFLVSYRTNDGDERITTESYKHPNATITGLKDDTLYYFRVIANNSNGKTLSEEEESCKTQVKITSPNSLPIIAGGAAGGVVFAGLVVIGILLVLRRINSGEGKKDFHQSKRVLNEDEETDEDCGVKDNILYISAGPREEEKSGMPGAAAYAEVNKKASSSDSNANVYAEVQKSGNKAKEEVAVYSDVVKPKKGLFKKEVRPKQKKGKKQKMIKENADVYENSEDIAMTQKLDDVYSNTADNNGTKSGNRGYKNQDGLLYVEVQFDQTQENGKPVIHGEDEKTDYATVEFPFPPSNNTDVP